MPEWLTITIHSLAAIVVLFLMTKLLGKRQITQLSLFEYITGITIGNLAAYISTEDNWQMGIISLSVWVAVLLIVQWLSIKSKRIRKFMVGTSTVLIHRGNVIRDNLKRERVTVDELLETLRKRGIFRLADVEYALMESSGEINVLLKAEHMPLTRRQLGLPAGYEAEPHTVVVDGRVLDAALEKSGRSRSWLEQELHSRSLSLGDVFIGQIHSDGELHVDLMQRRR